VFFFLFFVFLARLGLAFCISAVGYEAYKVCAVRSESLSVCLFSGKEKDEVIVAV